MQFNIKLTTPLVGVLSLLLFGFWTGAYAGADPAPTDWLPTFNKVSFDGNDTVFDAGVTQIRLFNGQWGNATSSPIDTLSERQNSHTPKVKACSIPNDVLSKYKNKYHHPEIWYCDLPEKIWFANGGYCGEGDDDPALNQGRLIFLLSDKRRSCSISRFFAQVR
jgi:hypothetical protein